MKGYDGEEEGWRECGQGEGEAWEVEVDWRKGIGREIDEGGGGKGRHARGGGGGKRGGGRRYKGKEHVQFHASIDFFVSDNNCE